MISEEVAEEMVRGQYVADAAVGGLNPKLSPRTSYCSSTMAASASPWVSGAAASPSCAW